MGQGKIPDAQHKGVGFLRQGFRHPPDIPGQMLAVPIGGDHAGQVRKLLQGPPDPGFQRGSLSLVDAVAQHHRTQSLGLVKGGAVLRRRAVVHHQDIRQSLFPAPRHHGGQVPIRIKGRDQNNNAHRISPLPWFSLRQYPLSGMPGREWAPPGRTPAGCSARFPPPHQSLPAYR